MKRFDLRSFGMAAALVALTALTACGGKDSSSGGGAAASPPPPTAGDLTVADGGGVSSSGNTGGPFSPASKNYTLTNAGGTSLNWTASDNAAWVTVSPTSGALAAGASTTLTVTINSNANGLAAGSYNATVTITNTTSGSGNTTRPVALTVNAPPPPPPGSGTGGSGGTAGTFNKTSSVGGVSRTYQLYVPSSAMTAQSSGPVKLLVGLHGAGDTGSNFITAIGMKTAASSNSCILVGPDAWPGNGGVRAWFLSSAQGWPGPGSDSLSNDVSFLLQMISEVGALYNVDTKRIYCFGFSRGAGMTSIMATATGNSQIFSGTYTSPFAAFGICAGYDPFGGALNFANSSPKRPCWLIHGTSDSAVPYSEGQSLHNKLIAAGYSSTFTSVSGAPHNWLWASTYGHSNQELIDFFSANPLP